MANSCPEHDAFFDAPEEISSESSVESEDSDSYTSELQHSDTDNELNSSHYDFWSVNPISIDERRDAFLKKTGFVLDRCHTAREGPDDGSEHVKRKDSPCQNCRFIENKEKHDMTWRIQSLDAAREFDEDETDNEGTSMEPDEADGNGSTCRNGFRGKFESYESEGMDRVGKGKQQDNKENWLRKFSFKASNMFNKDKEVKEVLRQHKFLGSRNQRVRVRSHKKWSKELSSLYKKQELPAHKGSILAMKFSPDGNYLATGGEDGTLNVWKVVEDQKLTDFDLVSFSAVSAFLNFSVNGIPNMACYLKFKEGKNVMNKLKKSSDSAGNGIMIPRKVFRMLEKPEHEFRGHEGDILDISWSKNGHLLSCSVDKTVRLWKVGHDQCQRIFPHNDFVTCAQFNPKDDDYFISGSIDGIVRIWDVLRGQVVDWIDNKEIVTAICYRPDGKGGIIGSMVGNCSFFDIADDYLHRVSIIFKQGKKTVSCKQITGFQFSPSNPSEVVVSSADNLVRVLEGANIICKLRGSLPLIDRGSQVNASFTADGKHIISATDDSNVYVWNHLSNRRIPNNKPRNIWSSESFISPNALLAVPWHGIASASTLHLPSTTYRQPNTTARYNNQESPDARDCHAMQHDEVGMDLQRSESTDVMPPMGDFDYDFLRNVCESILNGSHMWGLVIVTGGKDGQIRTFHNYGLPVRFPTGKSLRSSLSFSNFRNRCKENCTNLKGSTSFNR